MALVLTLLVAVGFPLYAVVEARVPARLGEFLLPLLHLIVSLVLVVLILLVYIRLFRRTMTVSLFFLMLALTATLFEGWKVFAIMPQPPAIDIVLATRLIVAARFSYVFFIFLSALFTTEFVFQRHGTLAVVVIGAAGLVAWNIPVDVYTILPNAMVRVGLGRSVPAVIYIFIALTVITFIQAGLKNQEGRLLLSAFAVAVLATGHELLFSGSTVVTLLAGTAGMILGGILFGARNYRDEILD